MAVDRICVLHIITGLTYGGAERLLVNVSNLMQERFEIHVVYFKDEPLLLPMLRPSIQVHHVPLGLSIVWRLRRLVQSIGPDIVHTHLGHGDLLGMAACAFLQVRRFCTMHNIWYKWNWTDRFIFFAYRFCFATIARNCQVIGISQCVANHIRIRLKVPLKRIHVVYNAIPDDSVSVDRAELRTSLSIPSDSFCLLFVGRLHLQKSIDTLLRAFAQLPKDKPAYRLLIVGEGNEHDRLIALKKELGLGEEVEFRGKTAHPEFYFAAADLFVLPSIFEGLGIVLLEAFRASLPVVASRVEGPAEIIEHGRNGLLFEPLDSRGLRDLILALSNDPKRREEMSQAGYRDYREKFAIGSYVESLSDLYRKSMEMTDSI